MEHVTDQMVDHYVSARDAQQVMTQAFASFGLSQAAMQARLRTEAGGVKLSTLGAVIPDLGVTGAKVYTTIGGRFSFVILISPPSTAGRWRPSMPAPSPGCAPPPAVWWRPAAWRPRTPAPWPCLALACKAWNTPSSFHKLTRSSAS